MSRSRYRIFDDHYPHFLTSTIVGWLPMFCHPELVKIIYDSWRFLQTERDIEIYGYVTLENHLHWIAAGPDLGRRVAEFKSYTAREIIDTLERQGRTVILDELRRHKLSFKAGQEYQLWQEGFHPKQISSDEMMLQKLEYSHNNPVKRGYVDEPVHWRYSSARNYAGMTGLLAVTTGWR